MALAAQSSSTARVAKDLADLQQTADLSLAIAYQDHDIRHVRALVIGPPDTPYEHGFFEFDVSFPSRYPMDPPKVRCITTDRGRTRFNPNIYACGKVCLSVLGTWHGEKGESWSCCQSLESVLVSIQSLMSANPYENEPGFETVCLHDPHATAYARKIQQESIRVSVIDRLEQLLDITCSESTDLQSDLPTQADDSMQVDDFDDGESSDISHESADTGTDSAILWKPFADLVKRRFLWYYDAYIQTMAIAQTKQKDGIRFPIAPFEDRDNQMAGSYQYANLIARTERVLQALHNETQSWIEAGLHQSLVASSPAHAVAIHFSRLKEEAAQHSNDGSRLEVELPNQDNPFLWKLTIFGEAMTNLDGGVFDISFVIPPDFPETWPRARMTTTIHHRNVSSNGTICYLPEKLEDLCSHVHAIVAAIDDKEARYDPRTVVNPVASTQFWSGEERKVYTRLLRRSAHDSVMQ